VEVSLSGGGVGVVGVGLGVVGVGFGGVGLVVVGDGLVAVGDGVVVEEDGVVAEGDGFVVEEGLGLVVEDVLEVETLVGDVAGPDAPSVPAGLHAVKPIRPAARRVAAVEIFAFMLIKPLVSSLSEPVPGPFPLRRMRRDEGCRWFRNEGITAPAGDEARNPSSLM